jgi:hypothetical protein
MAESGEPPRIGTNEMVLGFVVIFLLVTVEAVLFYVFPQNGYYFGMLYTGILALGVSLALFLAGWSYKLRLPSLASTGAFWFGAVMMLGACVATPNTAFGDPDQKNAVLARIPLLLFTFAIIAVGLGASIWSAYSHKAERTETEETKDVEAHVESDKGSSQDGGAQGSEEGP